MLLKITDAGYLGEYRLRLAFNDGKEGEADIRALAGLEPRQVFGAFEDESFIRQFRIAHGTLCWPGDRDVAPEYLYFLAFRNDPLLQPLFSQWGYLDDQAGKLAA